MKKCFKCGKEKDISEFYKHKKMADGHLGKCKDCTKLDSKIRCEKEENKPIIREQKRLWARSAKGKSTMAAYRATDKAKGIVMVANAKYKALYPKRVAAKTMVNNAVKYGFLSKPSSCSVCNKFSKIIHGHHCDYSKPLDVIWMCPSCHSEWHRFNEPING